MSAMTLTGKQIEGALPAQVGRSLQVPRNQGKDDRNMHLSPVLHSIRDDGPALIDGEVLPQQRTPAALPAAANAAPATATATTATATPAVRHDNGRLCRVLTAACLLLGFALAGTVAYAIDRNARVSVLEGQIQVLLERP